ncbi:hypothetical protein ABZ946_35180 [Streptomyces sp. NPDC046324]|uniref:hypothetical protein n=1 Tax=Streptomyces sp. NPDC046324 TaxID=3154915 RepID=UPI0033E35CBB
MSTGPLRTHAMHHIARLVATVPLPLGPSRADALRLLHWPGRRLLVQQGDEELAAVEVGGAGSEFRIPAPWPRRFGGATVSPGGDVGVYSGVHGVRAVDRAGRVLWEVPHGCWAIATCVWTGASLASYADDPRHQRPDRGSAAFSADGKTVWAHIRQYAGGRPYEEWLVLDAGDGTVLSRVQTRTVGAGSVHFTHPEPSFMGLALGQGDDDSPVLWGRRDGAVLTVERIEGEILQSVSPSGGHFLCTDPGQWALYLHDAADGRELRRLDARAVLPPVPGDDMARWGYEGAYPYEDGVVVSSEEYADTPRHWLVDPRSMAVRGRIAYPLSVVGGPRSAGPGMWWTVAGNDASVHLWSLDDRQETRG